MNFALIAAAGSGARMGKTGQPKQFLKLDGIPIIIRTIRQFEKCAQIDEIIVALPGNHIEDFRNLERAYSLEKIGPVVAGGETRSESVRQALSAIKEDADAVVAIHDGVRPFVTPEEISLTLNAARETGAAILAAVPFDTIKEIEGETVCRTVPRSRARLALTPQCFRYSILKKAYAGLSAKPGNFTDESMLVERMGLPVRIVEGHPRNIKITTREHVEMAKAILKEWE